MKHEMHAQSLPSIDVSNTAYSNNEYVCHVQIKPYHVVLEIMLLVFYSFTCHMQLGVFCDKNFTWSTKASFG